MLVVRSMANANGGNLEYASSYMKLALKAQSNCRTTLQAISDIQHPRQSLQQINMAENQQIINDFSPNKLTGDRDELRENRGAPRVEKADDSGMETVAQLNGPKNRRRKESVC